MDQGLTTPLETGGVAERVEPVRGRESLLALVFCWLQPGRRARAADRVPLWLAFAIHLAAGVLLALGACYVGDIADHRAWGHTLQDVFEALRRGLNRWPARVILALGGTVVGVEAGYVVLALLFMPWGARDERIRNSFARALRFLWLHSPHVAVLMLALAAWTVKYDRVWSDYRNKNYSRYMADLGSFPNYPVRPSNATTGSAVWNDWQKEMARYVAQSEAYQREHQTRWQRFVNDQPFDIRYGDIFICWATIAGSVWFLWSLLRAIGADRAIPSVARPPTCEFCGYNLTGTPIESRCPECGIPAVESLGPDARASTEWERRGEIGAWRAWWRSSVEAVLQPTRLGHQVRIGTPTTDHRWCAVFPLLPLFAVWAVTSFLSDIGRRYGSSRAQTVVAEWVWHWGAWTTGASAAGILFLVGLLAAAIVGSIQTWRHGRNLLPAAVRMTSYLGPFGGCWAGFVAVAWIILTNRQAHLWVNETVRLGTGSVTGMAVLGAVQIAAMAVLVLLIRYLRKPPATAVGRGLGLGGLLATWGFFAAFWPILFSKTMTLGLFRALRLGSSDLAEFILMTLLALPHLAGLVIGFVLVWKGTTAARYANR